MKYWLWFALCLTILAGCESEQSVDAPVAPTSVPLADSGAMQPTTNAESDQATAAPTDSPSTQASEVVPPADVVNLPPGFGISVYQAGLRGPRMLMLGPDNQLYAAERAADRIVRLPDADGNGLSDSIEPVITGLDAPSSLIFDQDGAMLVAETTRVLRFPANGTGFGEATVLIDGLPDGGNHRTRSLAFSPDYQTLYVSVGSSCNVCDEADSRRATIMAYDADGSNGRIFTSGMRNAVGVDLRPGTSEIWATNNGRDLLGDEQPPETVYKIDTADLDAGWPRCHSGRIVDPEFGAADACEGVLAPAIEMQAHSAPLGMAFSEGVQTTFPAPYNNGLFVAFHGSWNRSVPTGYKIVFIPLENGTAGAAQDFATGWLKADGTTWGRPADVVFGADGALYMSDDSSGFVYRIFAR